MKKQTIVAAIGNANAGKHTSRAGLAAEAASLLTTPDLVYMTTSLEELELAVRHIVTRKVDIIAILGGDGTLKETLTRLLRALPRGRKIPRILNVPLGTMRIVATSLGLTRMDALTLARHVAAKLRVGGKLETMDLHPLRVNREYGFLYGSALPVNMLNAYYREQRRGAGRVLEVMQAALLDELRAALTFSESSRLLTKPVHAKVTLPGHDPLYCPHLMHTVLMCAAVDQVGLGCRAMPDAMSHPGSFMLRSSQLQYWRYVLNLPRIWFGQSVPQTFDAIVNDVVIEYQEPTVATLDGEMQKPTLRDDISSGPALTFIIG